MRHKIALIFFLFIVTSCLCAQDGVQEKTFLTNSVVTSLGPGEQKIYCSALQSDGKLIVGGLYYESDARYPDVALARYNTDGTLDNTFGAGGIVITEVYAGGPDEARSIAIQPDGKIVVTGYRSTELFVARYTAAGALDTDFGTGGISHVVDPTYSLRGYSIGFQSDGKLVIGGTAETFTTHIFSLALFRFSTTGVLDNTFGTSGMAIYGGVVDDYTDVSMTIGSDDKIFITGSDFNPGSTSRIEVVCFNSDGKSLDTDFGSSGIAYISEPYSRFFSIKIARRQSTGEIIIGAYGNKSGSGDSRALIARLTSAGSLDAAFGTSGIIKDIDKFAWDAPINIKIQTDGKIIMAGRGRDSNFLQSMLMCRYNANGTIDGGFGSGGIVTNTVSTISNEATTIELQSDNKIILAGSSTTQDITGVTYIIGDDFLIARFNSNGSPDYSYSANKIQTALSSIHSIAKSLIIQPDGKIVTAGYVNNEGSNYFTVLRFNSNGTPDNSFNDNGVSFGGNGYDEYGQAAALQANGKIVVAGYFNNPFATNIDFEVMRFNTNGALDQSFLSPGSAPGLVFTDFGSGTDEAYGVAVQTDQKIVVAGSASNGSNKDFALVRYNTDGTPDDDSGFDTTPGDLFGPDGKVTTPIGTGDDVANCIAIQSDGKIIVAGYSYNGTDKDFALARYTPEGTLDVTFNTTGIVTTPIGPGDDIITCIATQADGKIVVAGYSSNGTNKDFALARYSTTGSLDATFGSGGKVTTPMGSGDDIANSIAVQADGKIIVAGSAFNGTKTDFALARYSSAGVLDNTTFGTGGKTTTNLGYGNDCIFGLAIQSDRKIVAAGITNNGANNDIAIVRYTGGSELLPVELTDFNAKATNNSVELSWTTATEVNNYGFEVERNNTENGIRKTEWETIGFVKGSGNSNSLKEYSFVDKSPLTGKLHYRLKQIDNDGAYKYYDAVAIEVAGLGEYKLMQNNPNPFNPVTAIKFQIPVNARVLVKVYNLLGSEIATLADEEKPSGSHIVYWNGQDNKGQMVSSGIYLYKLNAGNFTETRKMSFLK